jgi:hypothetical protein
MPAGRVIENTEPEFVDGDLPFGSMPAARAKFGRCGRHSREHKNAHVRSWAHEKSAEPFGLATPAILASA